MEKYDKIAQQIFGGVSVEMAIETLCEKMAYAGENMGELDFSQVEETRGEIARVKRIMEMDLEDEQRRELEQFLKDCERVLGLAEMFERSVGAQNEAFKRRGMELGNQLKGLRKVLLGFKSGLR